MTPYICETCGTQYEPAQNPPPRCPICSDDRQYVGWEGQRWTTMSGLATKHRVRLEDDAGLFGIGMTPAFAIDQRAFFLPTAKYRILWECTSLVTPEAVDAIKARGGIDLIAISHPHFYSAMVEWSDALGGVPILLHESDREWVGRGSRHIELWRGEEHRLSPGVTLIRCGGHFAGSTALHWQDERRPAGGLFPGDALQVVFDRRHVTFMYSYPNYIPLHPEAVRTLQRRLDGYRFDDVFGYTWGRNILGDGRAAVDRSFDRYLRAIGAAD
jgi:glyoxylase-like metal-dependent hydrolase (beta-lactamase superfamily II)